MMPISTAAPKTGRDIGKRVLLALLVACVTLGWSRPATAASATPSPAPAPPAQPIYSAPQGQMGYYMMQGSRIISQPFVSAPACFKALAAWQKSLPNNIAPIVCAHRIP